MMSWPFGTPFFVLNTNNKDPSSQRSYSTCGLAYSVFEGLQSCVCEKSTEMLQFDTYQYVSECAHTLVKVNKVLQVGSCGHAVAVHQDKQQTVNRFGVFKFIATGQKSVQFKVEGGTTTNEDHRHGDQEHSDW
jgi:hypothetical protein